MATKTKNSKKQRQHKSCHTPEQHKKMRADRNAANQARAEVNKNRENGTKPWDVSKARREFRRANDPNVQARKKIHKMRAAQKKAVANNEAA